MLLPRNPITAINRLQPTSVQALFWVGATLLSATAFATEARATMANAGPLADIVVTATRIPERRIDLPASIDRLDARALGGDQSEYDRLPLGHEAQRREVAGDHQHVGCHDGCQRRRALTVIRCL